MIKIQIKLVLQGVPRLIADVDFELQTNRWKWSGKYRGKLSNGECVMLAVVLVVIGPYFFSQPILKQENVLNLS